MTKMPDWMSWLREAEQRLAEKKWSEAAELARQALAIEPTAPGPHQMLGRALLLGNQIAEAIPHLEKAILIQPELAIAQNALGRCHMLMGDLERATSQFDRTLCLKADHGFAHFNRATAWLKAGRYHEGWIEYEWRWICGLVAKPTIPRPRWDGSPLEGRSILIHTEQGLGDAIQFVRFLPLLKQRGATVIFACQKALHAILRETPGIDGWFPIDEPGQINFDIYAPLLSLGALLHVDSAIIPQPVPYVFAQRTRIERWRKPLEQIRGFKVGLCWQGSPTFEGDGLRSIALKHYAALAAVDGVVFISLQKGAGEEQIEPNQSRIPMRVFDDLDQEGAFTDRGAIMEHLDLVITSDTSVAHLAGAMGRPVWAALSTGCDWRWLTDRADSPWYPTMRLFRQKSLGDWTGVFAEMAIELQRLVESSLRGGSAGQ